MSTSPPAASGTPPSGVSSRAWESYNTINSEIPIAQWQAWDQFVDPACPPGAPYRSQKLGANGQRMGTCEETPDNCPHGTTAYGLNQCLSIDDPKIQAAWNSGSSTATPAAEAAPRRPTTLQDVLMEQFQTRSGMFGFDQGRNPTGVQYTGALSVDQNGNPLAEAPNLTGRALSGGGVMWGANTADNSWINPQSVASGSGAKSWSGTGQVGIRNPPTSIMDAMADAIQYRNRTYGPNAQANGYGFQGIQDRYVDNWRFAPGTYNPTLQQQYANNAAMRNALHPESDPWTIGGRAPDTHGAAVGGTLNWG